MKYRARWIPKVQRWMISTDPVVKGSGMIVGYSLAECMDHLCKLLSSTR